MIIPRWLSSGVIGVAVTGLSFLAGGCANTHHAATRPTVAAAAGVPGFIAATQPASTEASEASANARLHLEQIEPAPRLAGPATRSSTNPTASLDAIETYAHAHDALLQNQRYTAINLLEKALKLDPDSFEMRMDLGRAYQQVNDADQALAAFERAAQIKPDDLEVQVELGRAYQSRNDLNKAIEHLRLAMQTSDYQQDDAMASVVDYRLAVALEQKGYDRAALDCYESLQNRLEHHAAVSRATPEIYYLLQRPELLYEEIGKLHEKLGEDAEALSAYRKVAEASPNDFDLQARIVRMLSRMGRADEAASAAADLVRTFHASPESIGLLREVYQRSGNRGAFADSLRRLLRQHPNDRSILFALAQTLSDDGHVDQASELLNKAIDDNKGDVEIVQRLYQIYADRDQTLDAARLIVRVTGQYPDATPELQPLFMDLLRLSRKNALRLADVQKIDVPASAQASKQFWIWRVAENWNRPAAARAALDAASSANPPFGPACRAQLDAILSRAESNPGDRKRAAEQFIESVRTRGRADLAAELRGLMALHDSNIQEAVRQFDDAQRLASSGPLSPELQLETALASLRAGDAPRFEQLMRKLISDRPRYDAGYLLLLSYYRQNNADAVAANLVGSWLAADPNNPAARIQQAGVLLDQHRGDEALAQLRRLFDQRPDDPDVVGQLMSLMKAAGQEQQLITLLDDERTRHPNNRIVVEALVAEYASQNKVPEAVRVIDAARAAVKNDPDLLYYVAHLYQLVDQPKSTEAVLQDVLKLDPENAPAGNDLGYTWADEGKNIDQAERLIRIAVKAEPDNPSYLDSLGWVLYKKSQFAQAAKLLQEACEPVDNADPIVLNHLGDALYRLNRAAEARTIWQQAIERLKNVPPRDELKDLNLQLQAKIRQSLAGQAADVAPLAVEATVTPANTTAVEEKSQAKK